MRPPLPAKQVQELPADIFKKPIGIDRLNPNLKELASPKSGNLLQQTGSERIFRYRFANPAMQPFVIMKGIQDGLLDEKAKSVLSTPEQGDLSPACLRGHSPARPRTLGHKD